MDPGHGGGGRGGIRDLGDTPGPVPCWKQRGRGILGGDAQGGREYSSSNTGGEAQGVLREAGPPAAASQHPPQTPGGTQGPPARAPPPSHWLGPPPISVFWVRTKALGDLLTVGRRGPVVEGRHFGLIHISCSVVSMGAHELQREDGVGAPRGQGGGRPTPRESGSQRPQGQELYSRWQRGRVLHTVPRDLSTVPRPLPKAPCPCLR